MPRLVVPISLGLRFMPSARCRLLFLASPLIDFVDAETPIRTYAKAGNLL